jgi:predicted ATPase
MPSVSAHFSSANFSDGTIIKFAPSDITVLVGPNNSGKSAALEGLQRLAHSRDDNGPVLADATLQLMGSYAELEAWLVANCTTSRGTSGGVQFKRLRASTSSYGLETNWTDAKKKGLGDVADFLIHRLTTEERLGTSRPAARIALLKDPFTHPLHFLEANEGLETRIAGYFRQAFGIDMMLHRGAGKEIPLVCGAIPTLKPGQDRLSVDYLRAVDELSELHTQGDGIRSFAGGLLNAFVVPYHCLLIDEPEAFLHPPQASLLGRMLATEVPIGCQLFLATHSGDFLRGLLDADSKRVRILRITRDGDINRVRELSNDDLSLVWSDSLLRHSNILDSVFHDKVVVCESDSDCRFYHAMLHTIAVPNNNQGVPDIMFTNAAGKDRMPVVVRALSKLGLPLIGVVDFDAIRDKAAFQTLVDSFGIPWRDIEKDWSLVKTAIEQRKPELDSEEVKKDLLNVLDGIKTMQFPESASQEIEKLLKRASAWFRVKDTGISFVPSGEPMIACRRLFERLMANGLFILEVGELERFCPSVGRHGPQWVNQVLQKDLLNDAELGRSRDFARELLSWKPQIPPA